MPRKEDEYPGITHSSFQPIGLLKKPSDFADTATGGGILPHTLMKVHDSNLSSAGQTNLTRTQETERPGSLQFDV